jgi:hypothetical protein
MCGLNSVRVRLSIQLTNVFGLISDQNLKRGFAVYDMTDPRFLNLNEKQPKFVNSGATDGWVFDIDHL